MATSKWLSHPLRLQRPELPPPTPPGLYAFLREADGTHTRFHLRVEPDGSGTLIANASAAARLTPSGVVMAKALLQGHETEEIIRSVLALFRGVAPETARQDLEQVRALVDRLFSPELRYPILNVGDAVSPHEARLLAPFSADVPLADPVRILPLLTRLWDAGIPHVVFLAPDRSDPAHLVRAVERAEDLGMIAGVRARASDLTAGGVLQDLARAGVDHVTIPAASPGREIHDSFYGEGDHAAIERAIGLAHADEVCAVAEVPLVESNLDTLEAMLEWLAGLGVAEVSFFTVAVPNDMPAAAPPNPPNVGGVRGGDRSDALPAAPLPSPPHVGGVRGGDRSDALPASMLPQVAALVEGAVLDARMRFFWQPPMRRDPTRPLADQVREGPRCSGDVAVRVEIDGSVIPPRGPYRAAGNLLRQPWGEIWESREFRIFRERIEAPSRCPDCPGLAVCAAECLREPAGWAEPSR